MIDAATGAALLEAIKSAPEDDVCRLAYADWLEECGDRAGQNHADFIRAQVANGSIQGTAVPLLWPEPHVQRAVRELGVEDGAWLDFYGGFLVRLCCTMGWWIKQCALAVELHPLLGYIHLQDRSPCLSTGSVYWESEHGTWSPRQLHPMLYDLLPGVWSHPGAYSIRQYDNDTDARVDLSRACLALARQRTAATAQAIALEAGQ